jgi:hypothetical protein
MHAPAMPGVRSPTGCAAVVGRTIGIARRQAVETATERLRAKTGRLLGLAARDAESGEVVGGGMRRIDKTLFSLLPGE